MNDAPALVISTVFEDLKQGCRVNDNRTMTTMPQILSKKSAPSPVSHVVSTGDPSWIAQALDRYEKPLLRYAAWLLDERDRARDVVQEVFLRLCQRSPEKVRGHLAEWLFKVCRNLAFDVRERESRRRKLDET